MALDKTLWKALRAGGLGHRAAGRLADTTSPYYIGITDLFSPSASYLYLSIASGTVYAEDYSPIAAGGATVSTLAVPLAAGTALELGHADFVQDSANDYPDLSGLYVKVVKFADANGIPVAPVTNVFAATRTDGVVALPSGAAGFTVAASDTPAQGFKVTIAAAGHYGLLGGSVRA